jgi:hypothetical protein
MSLSRLLVGIALIAPLVAAIAAAPASCPQRHSDGKKTGNLDNASVFDGPPEGLIDLMPDLENATWDIAMAQVRVKDRGESMYLVCLYKGIDTTVTLKISPDATFCRISGIKERTRAYCAKARLTPTRPLIKD